MTTTIHLTPSMFRDRERTLVNFGNLTATTFRYGSGVCALRMENEKGCLILLPFQGQQIWSAEFGDESVERRNISMRSIFSEPQPTLDFLSTFGGFCLHCGATGSGAPGPEDTHPLHGELPNAPYQEAMLCTGEDDSGPFMALEGKYRHQAFFSSDYLAEPTVKLPAGSSSFSVSMQITNMKRTDMDLMYAAHVNFRPVDNGKLHYSAPYTPEAVRLRKMVPSHIQVKPEYLELLSDLEKNPTKHHILSPDLLADPELVFFVNYMSDEDGWAHSVLEHPDGSADFIRHRPDELPRGTRWITRTPDQDAIALVEPGTCETEGYIAEKKKGNMVVLAPGEAFSTTFKCGVLNPSEASKLIGQINVLNQ